VFFAVLLPGNVQQRRNFPVKLLRGGRVLPRNLLRKPFVQNSKCSRRHGSGAAETAAEKCKKRFSAFFADIFSFLLRKVLQKNFICGKIHNYGEKKYIQNVWYDLLTRRKTAEK
jgi:hypothetical protein